jgi:DNA sulfur modification protein DndC
VTGQDLPLDPDDIGTFGPVEGKILQELASKYEVPNDLVGKLIDVELQNQGMSKRSTIFGKLDKVFSEDWRTDEKMIVKERKKDLELKRQLEEMKR